MRESKLSLRNYLEFEVVGAKTVGGMEDVVGEVTRGCISPLWALGII